MESAWELYCSIWRNILTGFSIQPRLFAVADEKAAIFSFYAATDGGMNTWFVPKR